MGIQVSAEELTFSAISCLSQWLKKNGWAGYDPYDIKGTRIYLWALSLPKTSVVKKIIRKLILGPLIIGEMIFPSLCRKIFRIKPAINAKGMSLLAIAHFNLFQVTKNNEHFEEAIKCLNWLLVNQSPGYAFPCWGYPFDWDSGVIVPALTPASVVSAAACNAFWLAFELTGEIKYLKICKGICEFFLQYLNIKHLDENTICFSYTPLDNFHVHNTNLLIAELLIKIGRRAGHQEWVSIGEKAANYALKEQNPDGSIFYWGAVQNHMNPNTIDHYHSGFEMRCLFSIWQVTGKDKYKQALDHYYSFYKKYLIKKENNIVMPLMYPTRLYPINIHSCAEGLLLNTTLAQHYPEARTIALQMVPWVIKKMQANDGHFIYMRRRFLGLEWCSKISYWRWGQAWMMLALSQLLLLMKNEESVEILKPQSLEEPLNA